MKFNYEKIKNLSGVTNWVARARNAINFVEVSVRKKASLKTKKITISYQGFSVLISAITVTLFVGILIAAWVFKDDLTSDPWLNRLMLLHTRDIFSLPAILFSNFFHKDIGHLGNNLIMFVPLGFWVFKQEGARGIWGIFTGMLMASAATWLLYEYGTVSLGFSSAAFACIGILLVRAIRKSLLQVVILCVLLYVFLEFSIFETIRPTAYTRANNISWLGHLGGLIGGMMSQIRNLGISLEMLHAKGKITDEEFVTIAARIKTNITKPVVDTNRQHGEEK